MYHEELTLEFGNQVVSLIVKANTKKYLRHSVNYIAIDYYSYNSMCLQQTILVSDYNSE